MGRDDDVLFAEMSTPTDFTGRVVVVSGAAGGIGRETLRQFASAGATVAALDIDELGLKAALDDVATVGGRVVPLTVDITADAAVRAAVAEIEATVGPIDVVYNNAGGSSLEDGPLHQLPDAEIERALNVDLRGAINLTRAALGHMVERGRGNVLFTTSCTAMLGFPGCDAYTMAKGAIVSLTRSMASEYARYGIRVNALAPGLTLTGRLQHFIDVNPVIARRVQRHVLGVCRPEDVVRAAMFLTSDYAERITGVVLPVDSGLTVTTE